MELTHTAPDSTGPPYLCTLERCVHASTTVDSVNKLGTGVKLISSRRI